MNDKHDSASDRYSTNQATSPADVFWKVLGVLASLRITVVLLSLGIVLVFFGTLAQIDQGIWTVMDQYFRGGSTGYGIVMIPFQLIAEFLKVFFDLPKDTVWKGKFPFPAGWIIGWAMVVNLLAAHAIRFRMTWKRSGILLIHSGMLLLMFGEFFTGRYAVESTMVLQNGETSSYIDDSRKFELAIRTPKDDKTQSVWVIPGSKVLSEKGNVISQDNLPIDVEIVDSMKNSDVVRRTHSQGEAGVIGSEGGYYRVVPCSEESGVKSEREDAAAARVRIKKKGTGEVLGEFHLSLWHYRNYNRRLFFIQPQAFVLDGHRYIVELRNRRIDKPYSIELKKFEHQVYMGTKKPKDYSSTVQLRDPESGEDRTVRIWMNNPLRFAGETFYQAGFIPDDSGTVLQVVNNPVWLWPYFSCSIISAGMLIHFLIILVGYLKKRFAVTPKRERHVISSGGLESFFPWALLAFAMIYLLYQAYPRPVQSKGMDVSEIGSLPVVDGGRVKPLDTVARTTLMTISNRSEFEDSTGKLQPAILWLMDVIGSADEVSSPAADYKVFRIENDQVLNYLNLKLRPGSYRYSLKEILGDEVQRSKLQKEFQRLEEMDQKKFTLFDAKLAELSKKLNLYLSLVHRATPLVLPPKDKDDWSSIARVDRMIGERLQELAQSQALSEIVAQMLRAKKIDPQTLSEEERSFFFDHLLESLNKEEREKLFRKVQARTQQIILENTERYREAVSPAAAAYMRIFQSYRNGDKEDFKEAVKEYKEKYLGHVTESQHSKNRFEKFYNQFAPFYLCIGLFVLAFVLGCCSWLGWSKPLQLASFGMMILTLILLTLAIAARIYLQGRPPVTNLYSSAVFIGWGAVILAVCLECFHWNSVGNVVGAVIGFATMIVAHHLGTTGGDTLEMMEAVLDTNFWLATHVTSVTIGYTATFITGALATVYIVWGVFFKTLDEKRSRALSSMIYGVLCFATLFSFVGTVLGGIWADQSWGRFWGWDPKENGAVLIVLWNVLILHARWAGLARQRGIAALAIVGNIITAWSWFGTNQLGVGLHAYGFSKELAAGCRYYWLLQMLIIGVALLPLKYWRSFSDETKRERAALAREEQRGQQRDRPRPMA